MRTINNDFSKGAVWKCILSQAIPLTLAQLVQLLYNVVDRIYIGHLPGASSLALTGIGLVFPIVTFVSAFTNLFGMGGAPLCSIARGAGEHERAERVMSHSFALLTASSVVIMILCYLFREPVLYAFGASDATYVYADDYLKLYLLGTPLAMLGTGMNLFINAQGFARIGMLSTMLGAAVNIVLDPIFIYGFEMGVKGAALATVISQGCTAVWVMGFLHGKKSLLKLRVKHFRLQWSLVREIVSLGTAGFIMSATNCAVQIVCNKMLKLYGGDIYVGVMTVINSVREIVSMPVMGITHGSQPVLGFNYGAKQYKRVRQGILFTSIVGVIYTTAVWLLVMAIPEVFIRLFSDEADMLAYGVGALKIYFFGFFMMSLQFAGQSTFTGLGRSKQAIFFSLFRKAIIVVPLTLLLPRIGGLGVNGVFVAEPISNFIGGLACYVTMMCTLWRELGEKEKEEGR
ncbi:MAG: MATE family efflux transporter [Lachnospiraceae bacterium]|nr:MATE family efflux transporter [Lachnospiraceae bacterium]